MPPSTARTAALCLLLLLGTSTGLVCSAVPPAPHTADIPTAPPELLVRPVAAPPGTLVFPPPAETRRSRPPLPPELIAFGPRAELAVAEPLIDAKRTFEIAGQVVRVAFNQTMARGAAPAGKATASAKSNAQTNAKGKPAEPIAAPGAVRITPLVAGTTRWVDERTLEFAATKPFDPTTSYAIELGEVAAASGRTLATQWKATFLARAGAVIAGKEIGYLPVSGEHRLIVVRPGDVDRIGPRTTFSALYDQPIELGLARSLVELRDEAGRALPTVLDHPRLPSFQGVTVDPRYVVLVRPLSPLRADQKVTLIAGDRGRPHRPHPFTVAGPLTYERATCGWNAHDDACPTDGGVMTMHGREVHLLFNNPLATDGKALEHRVRVQPPVRNLAIHSYRWGDGHVVISGGFEPSKSYDVAIDGVTDVYGQRLVAPVRVKVRKAPESASVAMAEGLVMLDEATTRRFSITTRNVAEAELLAWPIPGGDSAAFEQALDRVRARELPASDAPLRIAVTVKAARDRSVDTEIDLSTKLAAGASYVVSLRPSQSAFGADAARFPSSSQAARPPVALLRAGSPKALAVHVLALADATLVQVARLASGDPVAGASVTLRGLDTGVSTDARGMALLRGPASPAATESGWLDVVAGDTDLMLPLAGGLTAAQLFPDLASGAAARASDRRAFVMTDRGIYRPGSTAWIKANVRRSDADKLLAIAGAELRVRIVGPTGEEVLTESATTSDRGSIATRFAIPSNAKLGRYQLRVEEPSAPDSPLSSSMIQVAEFEVPRFAVDVQASAMARPTESAKPVTFRGTVRARYLFGAPMDGASATWTLKRRPAAFPAGPLTDVLAFRSASPFADDDDDSRTQAWSRAGEGRLAADGTMEVAQAVPLDPAVGPQELTLEVDVADASFRHVAGRASIAMHPVARYAGVKTPGGWVGIGEPFPVLLGAIDTKGEPVVGARVTARMEHVDWKYIQRRAAGGALRWEWTSTRTEVSRCAVSTTREPSACKLTANRGGDYVVTAEIDGRPGGSTRFWAWRDGAEATPFPSRGRVIELVADKARYRPGERAKLLVKSPYPEATAILTVEQGGLLDHRTMDITGGSAMLEIPLTAAHAPHAHATVTLLPRHASGEAVADYRIGAVRLPVALEGARLVASVKSDKSTYEPGREAEITVEVRDGEKPAKGAEVTLAVVDEGVLRLTGFHAPDPVLALRPGRALAFRVRDSRQSLADLFERSHVAGDGGGAGSETIGSTRKNFVETALWRPDLVTDDAGRVTVKLRLPDNLTEFRMMAVVLDPDGKGAVTEAGFSVRKPVMLIPAVPRFASVGDRFEAAAMLHNDTAQPIDANVTLAGRTVSAIVPAHGKTRVGFPLTAPDAPEMVLAFAVDSGGGALDRVEARIPVQHGGNDEHPHLAGSFVRAQEIALVVPADAEARGDEPLRIHVGQHLWPEIGARLEYLLDYPHGCVEQTTSSTLPLLSARTILPRLGMARMSDAELVKRIRAGLDRLASMRVAGGGLAYWPGGGEANVYGTAYAMRVVVLAKESGVAPPEGLLEGMGEYLAAALLSGSTPPEVQAAIAQSLAEIDALPASAADALHDRAKDQSVFGKASLAIALHALGDQEDRVTALLDGIEASFDAKGSLTHPPRSDDFHYFGSSTRSKAQAAIALSKLRPTARILPGLLAELAAGTESYTTQATAYSFLALAQHLTAGSTAGADVRVEVDGIELTPAKELGLGNREYHVPLASLRGRKATLRLSTDGGAAMGYVLGARYRRSLGSMSSVAATSGANGPEVYRVFTDPKGNAVDLAKVRAGDVLRVALLARLPVGKVAHERLGYLALTDRLPAGFEPIQPDLATVASAPDIGPEHPFASALRSYGNSATHVELRDDRVNVYFDRTSGEDVAATYLVRASTPGDFVVPPASAELMYEGDGLGYSDEGRVVVQ